MEATNGIERQTLSQVVTARLRDEILSGVLPPGERVVVQALAKRWGISHIPIREGLRELGAESLIQSHPGKGVVVAGLDIDELHDLYRLRRLLEVDVIRRGFHLYIPAHLGDAHAKFTRLVNETPRPGDGMWWDAHRQYHLAFLEPGFSPWSRRLLRLIWQSCERYERLFALVFGSVDDANSQHQRMLDASGQGLDEFLGAWLAHLDSTEATIASGYAARDDS